MFSRLPESNAQRQKRSGGFVVSTVVHGVLIALAVKATALTATPAPKPVIKEILVYHRPRPTPPPPTTLQRAPRGPTTGDVLTVFDAPPKIDLSEIPQTIPPDGSMSNLLNGDEFKRVPTQLAGAGDRSGPNVSDGQPLTEHFVDRPVVAMPGSASPRYPSLLQGAGVEGEVRAQFVVDTLGRVENGSIRILDTTHQSFAAAVRDALVRARFVPAEAGGRKVRQLVEQPFTFRLNRR